MLACPCSPAFSPRGHDLPAPSVSITVEGAYRVIRSNGLPEHATGKYHYHGSSTGLIEQVRGDHVHDGHVHAMVHLG